MFEMLTSSEIDWPKEANCWLQGIDMYPKTADQQKLAAKVACFSCRVRRDCLVEALNRPEDHGVWGGMTERERRALIKKHPNITDWNKVFLGDRTVAA